MSGFFFNPNAIQNPDYGCVTCGCSPCIYTDTFELASLDSRWKTEPLDGGTAPVFSLDDTNDKLEGTGDGSFTLQVTAPANSHKIWVEAEIEDISGGGATETGVIVGKLNSGEEIVLVRVWGTANGYELRQGTTVLQTFTDAGGNPIRLEITSPHESTTDVKCYIGGVLAHTETGVAWDLPGALYLGAYSAGGGRWAYVSMSPCPKIACSAMHQCGEFTLFPDSWTLDASSIGGEAYANNPGCETYNHCEKFAISYTFYRSDKVVAYQTGGLGCLNEFSKGWAPIAVTEEGSFGCIWVPVFPGTSRKVEGYPDIDTPGLLDDWPLFRLFVCPDNNFPFPSPTNEEPTPTCHNACAGAGFCSTRAYDGHPVVRVENRTNSDDLNNIFFEVRVQLLFWEIQQSSTPALYGKYLSPWVVDDGTVDFVNTPTVVTLEDTTDVGCSWPLTMTLVPNGNTAFIRRASDCDPCSECEGKTKKRAWEVDFAWQDADAWQQFTDTRLYKCLTMLCVNPPDAFTPTSTGATWLFRPEQDCGWLLCGSAIRVCDLEDFDLFGNITNANCTDHPTPDPDPSKTCCRAYNRAYVTVGYNHQESTTGTAFELIIWTPNWDRFDDIIASGPWVTPLVRYTSSDSICAEEVTFTKTLDNTEGTLDGGNTYFGLPYFPETLTARRVEMATDCDGPVFPEPDTEPPEPEWCPGSGGTPPAILWFEGVDPTPATPPGSFVYPSPEPFAPLGPGDLAYDGSNNYTDGNLIYRHQCPTSGGYVDEDTTISIALVFSDITSATTTATVNYTWTNGANSGSGSVGLTWSCSPLFTGTTATFTIQVCGTTGIASNHTLSIYIYDDPGISPAMASRAAPLPMLSVSPPSAKRKTPEDVPCVFRGGYLNTFGCCGDVYQCKCPALNKDKIRACTINPNTLDAVAACSTCLHRQETFGKDAETASP